MDYTALSTYLDPVRQAVLMIDDKAVLYANPAAKALLGSDITEKPVSSIFSDEITGNRAESFACSAVICDIDVTVSAKRDGDCQILYIEKAIADTAMPVSPQMMSYLRSCANGIKLSTDRCFSMVDSGEAPDSKHISILYHYYYCLIRLITQVDSAQKLRQGQFVLQTAPTDLVKLCFELTDTVSKLAADKKISIKFSCTEPSLEAVVDPQNFELMLLNLFSNSIKSTPEGGSITLSLGRAQENIRLSLDDTGTGIPEDMLSSLFSPEENTFKLENPDSGLGLGLYIAGSIVRLHKGVMLAESHGGEGTHIRINLPAQSAPTLRFNTPEATYRKSGISPALTELSDILPASCYGPQFED